MERLEQLKAWERQFGREYPCLAKDYFAAKLEEMCRRKMIGPVVLDLGCGANPVTSILDRGCKILLLDTGLKEDIGVGINTVAIKTDITDTEQSKQVMEQALLLLEIPISQAQNEARQIDTIVMSEILNYVDWRKLINFYKQFLKKNGRLIICNATDFGLRSLFHPERPSHVGEIISFLQEHGFLIEECVDLESAIKGGQYVERHLHEIVGLNQEE